MPEQQKQSKEPSLRMPLAIMVASAAFWLCSPEIAASSVLVTKSKLGYIGGWAI